MKIGTEETGFAVQPKTDCPHINEELADNVFSFLSGLKQSSLELECIGCQDKSQNWFCLVCKEVRCSRYVKGHMAEHNHATGHVIGLSFRDGSYWCYSCDSYIESKLLLKAELKLSAMRIQEEKGLSGKQEEKKEQTEQEKIKSQQEKVRELELLFKLMGIKGKKEEQIAVTLEEITQGIKEKKYKKVLVLTGAGLSVGAGIPDFRSPGTGIYSKLQSYNLPYPEAIFELSYFKKHPTAFLALSKELLSGNFEPTLGHHFIKKLQDEDILLMNMTQNIDDLEIKAGLKEEKLLQAHGHSRSAHCIQCHQDADIVAWKEHAAKEQAYYCKCGGLVKPDIVFFGEQLPKSFFNAPKIVGECDLAIIIGTSLKVNPFAYLAQLIPEDVPVVLINRDEVLQGRNRKLWLKGDIQENIQKIMEALEWNK